MSTEITTRPGAAMPVKMGREAVVIGAGMGGLTAASALSAHFDHVTVLEQPEARAGTPQSRHPHVLLLSGQLYGTNVGVER
jgi:cation diffusion facilitator CzcD-associated flavoprotein CzcO